MSGSAPLAAVACGIEVYPFEGGPYWISGGQIKSVTVSKTLQGGANGTFSIELAPGGPNGPESIPDWIQVITPASHVLIGMSRGADAAIVMDGVVALPSEDQVWQTNAQGESTAARQQLIAGADFAWFFNTQNWYMLSMYGLVAPNGLRDQLGFLPIGLVPAISQGLVGMGSPVQIGKTWFEKVMAGPGAMMGQTFVPYQGGDTRVPFNTLVSETMEQYPGIYIPYTEQFLGLESWMAKFLDIFPWPWYEFFVTTAPSGTYALNVPPAGPTVVTSGAPVTNPDGSVTLPESTVTTSAANVSVPGRTFTMRDFPTALPAGPQLVARVNPVPRFNFDPIATTQSFIVSDMDVSRWNTLPLHQLSGYGFYESHIEFTADEARNFYMLNPTAYQTTYGDNGSNVIPFPFKFLAVADPASVHRYGYRPANGTTRWMFDWNGTASQQALAKGFDVRETVVVLTAALASWWHPLPLMARGAVEIPLAPSVYVGTRWRYAPFKDGVLWDFYIEGVRHRFEFGGQSTTTLTLTRGLPTSVYADTSTDGLLRNIYIGNARRQDGVYRVGLPAGTGQALQVFATPENANDVTQQMTGGSITPQWPSQ
jgi:hypothetical protein